LGEPKCTPAPMDDIEWTKRFIPFQNPSPGSSSLFDPGEPEDAVFLDHLDDHHIWTDYELCQLQECGCRDGCLKFATVPGRRGGKCLGYSVTLVPWTDDEADLIVIDDCG
jgi:hypothetical protein